MRAMLVRKSRSLTAIIAVTVAATIATALLSLSSSTQAGISREFRGFGANAVVSGTDVQLSGLQLQKGEGAVPLAFITATAPNGSAVVVVGTEIPALLKLNSYWKTSEGARQSSVLVGSKVFAKAKFSKIEVNSKLIDISGATSITSGDADDSRIFVPLTQLREVAPEASTQVVLLAIPGDPEQVNQRIQQLRAQAPQYTIEPTRSIIETQASVLRRMHSVMLLSTALIATIAALSLWASLTAAVFERRRDFAVLKALGASRLNVTSMFLVEQFVAGIIGALLGYVLGTIVSMLIVYYNFNARIQPRLDVLGEVTLVALAIVLVGSLLPLERLQKIQPAAILKGE
jgi:putative ABC transport system permease protein